MRIFILISSFHLVYLGMLTYDYSYDIVTPNENPSYSYKSLESYMKKAENIYLDEKLKSTRNNNYVEI